MCFMLAFPVTFSARWPLLNFKTKRFFLKLNLVKTLESQKNCFDFESLKIALLIDSSDFFYQCTYNEIGL